MFSLAVDKAYNSLISRNLVDTANPANSKLMQYIEAGHNTAVNMTGEQKALILKWITEGAKGEIVPVSYSGEVEPLWAKYSCTLCHSSGVPTLSAGKSWASLTTNNLVIAKNPAGSPLMVKINTRHNGASDMTQAEKDLVTTWILQGALNN
jgi:hypothetical protein